MYLWITHFFCAPNSKTPHHHGEEIFFDVFAVDLASLVMLGEKFADVSLQSSFTDMMTLSLETAIRLG